MVKKGTTRGERHNYLTGAWNIRASKLQTAMSHRGSLKVRQYSQKGYNLKAKIRIG